VIKPMDSTARRGRRVATGLGLVAALALTGCAKNAPQDTFKAEGPEARKIRDLIPFVGGTAVVIGILVFAAVIFVVVRFRERPGGEMPKQIHGNTKLELTWTIIPALILIGVAVPTIATVFDLAKNPAGAMQVSVVGQQWWWEFNYPADGVVTANELVIPAQTAVHLSITSRDVIHSFWLPRLNGKKDAVPGRVHQLNLEADHPGEYWGQCTEFCGLSHANMRIRARVLSKADYTTWLANQKKDRVVPAANSAEARGEATYVAKCASCHQINGVTTKDANGKDVRLIVDASASLVAGAAPNLTHFATRSAFAGATFPTYVDDPATKDVNEGDPYSAGAKAKPNIEQLKAWLRNPPGQVAMAPNERRGMPNLRLSENEINDLTSYLLSLK
jgi:cytochrome c oxidase subunit 2